MYIDKYYVKKLGDIDRLFVIRDLDFQRTDIVLTMMTDLEENLGIT